MGKYLSREGRNRQKSRLIYSSEREINTLRLFPVSGEDVGNGGGNGRVMEGGRGNCVCGREEEVKGGTEGRWWLRTKEDGINGL